MDNVNHNKRDTFIRYLVASVGLFLVAIGVAVSILSNLGTSPLSCPSYVLNGVWGLTVGNWTIVINMIYLLIQMAILRKDFKAKYLMQILATVVFGYMIDFSIWCFSWLHPNSIAERFILIIVACLVTALGTSIEVIARAWMLSAEMTVYAVTKKIHKPFGNIKVAMDCILVVVSILIAWLMYHNPFGFGEYEGLTGVLLGYTEGVVIGSGTLLMAVLVGTFMKFTDPVADRIMDRIIERLVFRG